MELRFEIMEICTADIVDLTSTLFMCANTVALSVLLLS